MANQNKNGKAFEFALAISYYNYLIKHTKVELLKNKTYEIAKSKFEQLKVSDREKMLSAAVISLKFIIDIEPRLIHSINSKDLLQVELASDKSGQKGDVRDILFIRLASKWEIGLSAKNNHRALKHSRLSHVLDFGEQWINIPCSNEYWNDIAVIFDKIKAIRILNKYTEWSSAFSDIYKEVYTPLLEAWKKEVLKMYSDKQKLFCQKFVHYLIGQNDFYKIVKGKTKVEIHGFNINGSLNKAHRKIKSMHRISKIKLPTRLLDLSFKPNYLNTLIATFDGGWQISFRVHSAKSIIEPSLKFDIQLVSIPNSLFKTDLFYN